MIYYMKDFTLNYVLEFENELKDPVAGEDVIFDFSRVYKYDPLPMLLVGSVMRKYRNKYPNSKFYIKGEKTKSYPATMGFFKYISPKIEYGKAPGESKGSSNYLPITKICINELQNEMGYLAIGELLEKEAGRLANVVDRGNNELHMLLTYLIREILRNIPEHADCDEMWICGQYWEKSGFAEISIIDEGIGVHNSILKNNFHQQYITDNISAIKYVLKPGISEDFIPSFKIKSDDIWANSGYGLYMVSEICKFLNGEFIIISTGDYVMINNNGINTGKAAFNGTAITLKVSSEKIKNAQEIIKRISNEGLKEASSNDNAFKNISKSSGGLIDKFN